ncbi:MAG TPA: hypothetical protein VGD67_01390 [Pseudonocardiaceae bacterium]
MGLVFTSGEWEPGRLPGDWLGDDGFPRALRVTRREVWARGGDVVRDGEYEWRVVPPDPTWPELRLRFVPSGQDAGDVGIDVPGARYTRGVLVDSAMAYQNEPGRPPSDPGLTYLDSAVLGILNGGLHEWTAFGEDGEWVERGWALDDHFGGHGSREFNVGLPPDRRVVVRREHRDVPGWPPVG